MSVMQFIGCFGFALFISLGIIAGASLLSELISGRDN